MSLMRTAAGAAMTMRARRAAGYGISTKPKRLDRFSYPSGEVWALETVAPM